MKVIQNGSESKLLELVSGLKESPEGFYALHYNLSQLGEEFRSEYQVKIAINILSDLFRAQDSVIFVFEDFDVVVLYNGHNRAILEKAIFQLRYLFMDDPLGYNDEGFENEDFCNVYDLEFQWRDFFVVCKKKAKHETTFAPHKVSTGEVGTLENEDGIRKTLHVFDPLSLDKITKRLQSADISSAFRSQPICAISKGKTKVLFNESYVNISSLKDLLGVNVDLSSSRTLFKYMTKTLDKRVIKALKDYPRNYAASPISINLNARTLLSEDFAAFDSSLDKKAKASIIIEINISDVFEDINRFVVAKDAVQKLGYRICLDGLDSLSFTQINRQELGFDLAKLQWHPEMGDLQTKKGQDLQESMKQAVDRCGANRIILCHCDNHTAVEYGRAVGISLFQGRHIDKMLNPESAMVN